MNLVKDNQLTPATANQSLAALRGVLRVAWELELIPTDDYFRARSIKDIPGDAQPAGRCLGPRELEHLLQACEVDSTVKGCRDLSLLLLLAVTGLHRDEVAQLERKDYERSSHELTLQKRHRGNQRAIYLETPEAREALEAWLHIRGESPGPLFLRIRRGGHLVQGAGAGLTGQAIYHIVVERAKEGGLPELSPRDFRRTFLGELLQNGMNLSTVQDLAGHADPKTTRNYAVNEIREK